MVMQGMKIRSNIRGVMKLIVYVECPFLNKDSWKLGI
jgi:hypothetical protein